MNFLTSLFSKKNDNENLKLKFIIRENTWHVIKGSEILYAGKESMCKQYIENIQS